MVSDVKGAGIERCSLALEHFKAAGKLLLLLLHLSRRLSHPPPTSTRQRRTFL